MDATRLEPAVRAVTGMTARRVTIAAILAGAATSVGRNAGSANKNKKHKKKGKRGPTGPAGPTGPTGPGSGGTAVSGPTGPTGPTGPGASSQAEMWVDVQTEQTWTNLGSSSLFGSLRHVVDLSNFTEIKLMGLVSTAGTGELRVDWEINPNQNDFATLVESIDLSTTGVKQTAYVGIPSEARGLINIVAAAAGGSGSGNSPVTRGVALMVR